MQFMPHHACIERVRECENHSSAFIRSRDDAVDDNGDDEAEPVPKREGTLISFHGCTNTIEGSVYIEH